MRSYLFFLLKSPFEDDALSSIKTLAGDAEKAVLLSEDGIYHAVHSEKRTALIDQEIKIFAVEDNLAARGYEDFQHDDVEIIHCDRAVNLIMEEYDTTITI